MNNHTVDSGEIAQITQNVHDEKTEIYIPCITTYDSFLGKKNEFSDSAEIFFEFSALHKSRGTELKQRKDPVRVFRTAPIQELLLDIAQKEYDKSESLSISKAIQLVFGATEPPLFESVMPPELSIFEKANILEEECGDASNIIIISNHPKIGDIKKKAEEESASDFSDGGIEIINTNEWLAKNYGRPEVLQIIMNLMRKEKKSELKIGKEFSLKFAEEKK